MPAETDCISQCFDKCACAKGRRARPGQPVRGVSKALLDLIGADRLAGATLLEVGCGLGGLTREALARGVERAQGVDLSPQSIREASRLTAEPGLADRIMFAVGDGSQMDLGLHDVVVLDKVICCYPKVDALLDRSLSVTGETYAIVLPFSRGWRGALARLGIGVENGIRRVRHQSFRAFVHDVGGIETRIAEAGLRRIAATRRFIWYVAVYGRSRGRSRRTGSSPSDSTRWRAFL
jgi:magnesium-protoporphyrin O-methyltransferase